jgi:DNA-directed RNA polymerase specialized sigma24 family protein
MRSPESFDAFYVSTRDRLLHETYALTGDVPAARTAVRDAFAVAWHHWRKVAVLDDPEGWVRPLAHGRGRRRHTARLWHRDKDLDPEVRATLDALGKLSHTERQLLVLTTLSRLSMAEIARAAGLPRLEAERQIQTATSTFATARDIASTDVRRALDALRGPLEDVRWPRAPIVRRAGTARRRTHTAIGMGLVAAALIASGSIVSSGTGAEPSALGEEKASPGIIVRPATDDGSEPLSEAALLTDEQVERFGPRLAWSETETTDNLDGDGLLLPCQAARYAAPESLGALARTWTGTAEVTRKRQSRNGQGGKGRKQRPVTEDRTRAIQYVEKAPDAEAAGPAFLATSYWFAGCAEPRTQLLSTRSVERVGTEASVFALRSWSKDPRRFSVGVARTGQYVVTLLVEAREGVPNERETVRGLSAAVNALCGTPGAAECAANPRTRPAAPLPLGDPPGLLAALDLPPVVNARGPWVGPPAAPPTSNFASSSCDRTQFTGKGVRRPLARTFVFPESPKATEFALSQTVALMNPDRGRAFVEGVRSRIRQCAQANLGTQVTNVLTRSTTQAELTVWALEIEVSDSRTVPFFMAIMRQGNKVSQVGFSPHGKMTMARPDFVALAERAQQRLANLTRG